MPPTHTSTVRQPASRTRTGTIANMSITAITMSFTIESSPLAKACVSSWIRWLTESTASVAPPLATRQRSVYDSVSASRHASAKWRRQKDNAPHDAHGTESQKNSHITP